MPDEHDHDGEPDGPHRPATSRSKRFRTEHPGPDGDVIQEQSARAPQGRGHAPDPRFAEAALTPAEQKALYEAPDPDSVCRLLGQFQEQREKNGQLPQPGRPPSGPEPVIAHMSPADQVQRGLRPTPQQLAYIQDGRTPDEQAVRAERFLQQRAEQNKHLFQQSRRWGPEPEITPQVLRPHGPQGDQAWRADLDALRNAALRDTVHETIHRYSPSTDPRFRDSPLNQTEAQALHNAATPQATAQLLGQFHEDRLKDGRLPPASGAHPEQALLNQALTAQEQLQLGVRATAGELAHLQAGLLNGSEFNRTLAFITDRKALNAQWHDERHNLAQFAHDQAQQIRQTQDAADHARASAHAEQAKENSTPQAERDARTEKTDRRLSIRQVSQELQQRREKDAKNEGKQHGRDQGGRER